MRKWGVATIVTATFAACSPFSSSSDAPRTTPDGDASTQPELEAGTTSGSSSGTTGDAALLPGPTSCKDAPTNLFCDDFSTSDWNKWIYPQESNPAIQFAPNAKAHLDSSADTPSSPFATFEFPEPATDSSGECGYAWVHQLLDLTAAPRKRITVAFDMRIVNADPSDTKESVALVLVRDANSRRIEHYVMIRDPRTANVYEQWTGTSGKTGTAHRIGDLSEPTWVRLELTIDAEKKLSGVDLAGVTGSGSVWNFGDQALDSIAQVVFGVGYTCTSVGGKVQFDNVLVTSN